MKDISFLLIGKQYCWDINFFSNWFVDWMQAPPKIPKSFMWVNKLTNNF